MEQKDTIIAALIIVIIVCLYFWNKAVHQSEDQKKSIKMMDRVMRRIIGGREEGIGGYVCFTSDLNRDSPIRVTKGIMFRSKLEDDNRPSNFHAITELVDKWSEEILSRENDMELDL